MPEIPNKGFDPVGAQALARTFEKSIDGVGAFLGRICNPMADELGLFLKDRMHHWRVTNMISVLAKADAKMNTNKAAEGLHAHPRIVTTICQEGSYQDDPLLQEMWGGLLAASCTEDGDDDSNLLFTRKLSTMTRIQARIVKYFCEKAHKFALEGLIQAQGVVVDLPQLQDIAGTKDLNRLDRELDELVNMGLIVDGLSAGWNGRVAIQPQSFTLHMYVRCEGSLKSPIDFFGASEVGPLD